MHTGAQAWLPGQSLAEAKQLVSIFDAYTPQVTVTNPVSVEPALSCCCLPWA